MPWPARAELEVYLPHLWDDNSGFFPMKTRNSAPSQYDANYGNFRAALYEEIRKEAFGEDIGQNSWHTAAEQDQFLKWLDLTPGKVLLDVACGAGGPALRIAQV